MKTKRLLTIFATLTLVIAVLPLSARLGGSGSSASFLTMGAGARPISMGCAYTAFAEGPDALFWNPAGIVKMKTPGATFGQAILFAGMLEENLAAVIPLGEEGLGGILGVNLLAHLSGPIEITTFEDQDGTGNYYTANNYAIGITYAYRMTEKFSTGLTIKGIDLTMDKVAALGFAVDAGATYVIKEARNLRLGFVIQNFGPDMRYRGAPLFFNTHKDTLHQDDIPANYESDPVPLPFSFAGGAAIDLIEPQAPGSGSRFTLAADFVHLADQPSKGAIGVEYGLNEMFFLRGGLGLNTSPDLELEDTTQTLDAMTIVREVFSNRNCRGPSAGLGLKIPIKTKQEIVEENTKITREKVYNLAVDYSFEWHWYLNPVHRASLVLSF